MASAGTKKWGHTFQGGGYLSDLMRAVVHFINRWGRTKGGRLSLEILRAITALVDAIGPPTGSQRR